MKTITNLIIIDASGSMIDKIDEVKGGLKQLFSDIRKDAKKDKKTTKQHTIVVDFSSKGDMNTLIDYMDSVSLKDEVADKYETRGMTALYDAIGYGFSLVPKRRKQVFVSIITDGQENDSKELDYKVVQKLIGEKKKEGWIITFMGTTEQAIKSATSMGISAGNTFRFADSKKGMKMSSATLSSARSMYYAGATVNTSYQNDSLLEEAQEKLKKDKHATNNAGNS